MNGPSFSIQTDDEDDIVTIDQSDLKKPMAPLFSPMALPQMPPGSAAAAASAAFESDPLINPGKVSAVPKAPTHAFVQPPSPMSSSMSSFNESDSDSYTTDSESAKGMPRPMAAAGMAAVNPMADMARRMQAELNEKKEIIYQLDRLESKGYRIPRKFTIQSDLEEMRTEYHRLIREKEVDASIRFQRKMLMAAINGIELLNTKFDPFNIKLDGWAEQVHSDIQDYDDVFEELHEKHKSTGKKMAPELRLLIGVSGSAFMYHMSQTMFKQAQLPAVEQVLRSDPNLMRQFQAAAMQQVANGNAAVAAVNAPSAPPVAPAPPANPMLSMLGNFFGMNAPQGRPTMPAPKQQTVPSKPPRDEVDEIIADVSASISAEPSRMERIERISINDDDITSLIESEIDGVLSNASTSKPRGKGRPRAPQKKTLSL